MTGSASRKPIRPAPIRLAWASPLPPQGSGIADYSAELLPVLARLTGPGGAWAEAAGRRMEIELVVDDSLARQLGARQPGKGPGGLPLVPVSELPARHRAGRYDAVLYHLGNDRRFHGAFYRCLAEVPGIVVLHEYVLHHLVAGLTLGRGDGGAYVEEMRYAYGDTGEALARKCLVTGVPLDPWAFPLFERIVDRSRAVLVHNLAARERVLASRPEARVVHVPHHLSVEPSGNEGNAVSPEEALADFGVPAGALVVASFGFVTPEKRLDLALSAFDRLCRETGEEVPEAIFLIVGEVAPAVELEALLAKMDEATRDRVIVTGRAEMPAFLAAMRGCDIALNLRHPTGGETSGTLMRLLGLGKPVIVTRHGAFAEVPEGCAAPIDPGPEEAEVLYAVLRRLAVDPELRRAMGEGARRHMASRHTLEGSARGYAELIARVVDEDVWPEPAVPPLAPARPEDLASRLAGSLGAELVDLGIDEWAGTGDAGSGEKRLADGGRLGDRALELVSAALVSLGLADDLSTKRDGREEEKRGAPR